MQLTDRTERYEAIEEYRDRPLIVYATSTRQNVGARMASDAVRELIDQIDAIDDGEEAVDVLIHSTGGDALAAWKLMSILREQYDSITVLVPYMAFSAATIFALGADEIVMHPHASLGPIDPQIQITQDGQQRRFSFEDVGAFIRFLSEEVEVSEQAYVSSIMEKLFDVIDPVHVGSFKRASELATDVGERQLLTHMTGAEEKARARTIAEELNKSFFAHGDAVSRSRARELNLQIADDDPELEALIWDAFLGLESYMQLREPFNPIEHFLENGGADALKPKSPLKLPPGAPDQIMQQLWKQVAQQALQDMAQPGVQVDYQLAVAVVESPRVASEYTTKGVLTAARVGGGEIQLSNTKTSKGWRQGLLSDGNGGDANQEGETADPADAESEGAAQPANRSEDT